MGLAWSDKYGEASAGEYADVLGAVLTSKLLEGVGHVGRRGCGGRDLNPGPPGCSGREPFMSPTRGSAALGALGLCSLLFKLSSAREAAKAYKRPPARNRGD